MATAVDQPQVHADASEVIDAACRAWRVNGAECRIGDSPETVPGLVAALAVDRDRCIEFVVGTEAGQQVWDALTRWPRPESWRVCVLVPKRLLGQAHEHLRDGDFELQGWWVESGGVSFGTVEIA